MEESSSMSHRARLLRSAAIAGIMGAFTWAAVATSPTRGEPAPLVSAGPSVSATDKREPANGTFVDRMSLKGQRARGLYFTYPYVDIFKARGVTRLISHARLDAAVIDLKD